MWWRIWISWQGVLSVPVVIFLLWFVYKMIVDETKFHRREDLAARKREEEKEEKRGKEAA